MLIAAFFLRVLFEINNPLLTSDNAIQLEASKNKIQTNFFANSKVESSDLSDVKIEPLQMWPLGLSISVNAINLFINDILNSLIIFEVLGAIIMLSALIKLLGFLSVGRNTLMLFLILYAFNPSPFIYLGSTDLMTAALFIWMTYLTLDVITNKKAIFLKLIGIAVLSFYTAILRYACIPNLVIIPFFFFGLYVLNKNKKYLNYGFIILLISVGATFFFYKLFPIASGRTGFLDNIKNGNFYFEHLKWFDPFPFKALFFTRPFEFRLPSNATILFIYRLVTVLFSLGLLVLIKLFLIRNLNIRNWIAQYKEKHIHVHNTLILLFVSATLIIVGFISMQSITTPPESDSFGPQWMPPFWTFVYSTRYFVYLMFFVIVLFFISREKTGNSKIKKIVWHSIYGLALIWSISYWLYMNYQFYLPNGNGAGSELVNKKNAIKAYKNINQIYNTENKPLIIYTHYTQKSNEGLVTNYAFAHTCNEYENIVNQKFRYSSPLILILTMPKILNEVELQFLEKNKHEVLSELENEQIIRINLL